MDVQQLYAVQSHHIDSGRAAEWAATFTADGEFHSPSYPAPVVGTAELTAFAQRFADQQIHQVSRHVLTNIAVTAMDADTATVHAYLQIVTTPLGGESRLVRMTTIADSLRRVNGRWLVAKRTVTRDDTPTQEEQR